MIFQVVLLVWAYLNCFAQLSSTLKEDLPLLEIGAGAASFVIPDYPGSNQNSTYTLPFPTGIIRDETLRVDEDGGARGRFFKNERIEVNLSFGGSLPVRSQKNRARSGMNNIDPLLEIGPGLIITLLKPGITKNKLALNLPLRQGISSDLKSIDNRGIIFNPLLYYYHEDFLFKELILFSGLEVRFASEKYQDYFYEVPAHNATATRPEFNAQGGYVSRSLSMGLAYNIKNRWTLFTATHYSDYHQSKNQDSPLMTAQETLSYGAGFIWWFYQSEARGTN
ncbi:MAG: hypothetical protein Fur0010_01380 [Bdellovibrio sp.]